MTDESKATPRPWRAAEELALDYRPHLVVTADGKSRIALMYSGGPIRAISKAEERANAALIVAAVNAHDALVAERDTLKAEVDNLRARECMACGGPYPNEDCGHLKNARDLGRQAPCAPVQRDVVDILRTERDLRQALEEARDMLAEYGLTSARIREVLGDGDLEEGKSDG